MYRSGILLGWILAILLSGERWSEIMSQNDLYYQAVILKWQIIFWKGSTKTDCMHDVHLKCDKLYELVLHMSYLVWMQSEDAHGLFRFVR